MFTPEIRDRVRFCVLAWLATADSNGNPNVSPKEVYKLYGEDEILIANIASPGSVKNIWQNSSVCLSVLDILAQKGYQFKGQAEILDAQSPEFESRESELLKITKGKYPFKSLTRIRVESIKPILAPSYWLFPDSTEAQKIEEAKQQYMAERE